MTAKHFLQSNAEAVVDQIAANLIGHTLSDIEWRENNWLFLFSTGAELRIECLWRIVSDGRILFAESDDGQQFGRPVPVDGRFESRRLLLGKPIDGVRIRPDTADLTVVMNDATLLELWSNSSGYEAWEFYDTEGFHAVAMGGGRLATWSASRENTRAHGKSDG
jgi:hypothetical protein